MQLRRSFLLLLTTAVITAEDPEQRATRTSPRAEMQFNNAGADMMPSALEPYRKMIAPGFRTGKQEVTL
jgi:hypothetical protein